jgi:hypothetical protein
MVLTFLRDRYKRMFQMGKQRWRHESLLAHAALKSILTFKILLLN